MHTVQRKNSSSDVQLNTVNVVQSWIRFLASFYAIISYIPCYYLYCTDELERACLAHASCLLTDPALEPHDSESQLSFKKIPGFSSFSCKDDLADVNRYELM